MGTSTTWVDTPGSRVRRSKTSWCSTPWRSRVEALEFSADGSVLLVSDNVGPVLRPDGIAVAVNGLNDVSIWRPEPDHLALVACRLVDQLSDCELMLVRAAIYWAEGAKDKPWRRDECLTFVNSDPSMISVFLGWLELLGVDRQRVTFRLQVHETADVGATLQYWAELVEAPVSSFKPTTLKTHRPLTSRRNISDGYRGCLAARVRRSVAEYRAAEGPWFGVAVAADRRRDPPRGASDDVGGG